jgi:hypothetical protein
MVLRFYARGLPAGKHLDYRSRRRWPAGGPKGFVVHRHTRPRAPLAEIDFAGVGRNRLAAEFDHAAISGSCRRVGSAPPA